MKALTLAIVAMLVNTSSLADWKCTMPNGRIVYRQLSACPPDAIKSEQVETVPDTVQPEFKGSYPPPRTPETPRREITPNARAATNNKPSAQKERSIVDEAYGICAILTSVGATTCDVEVNIFSASYIDATVPTNVADAQKVCANFMRLTREPGSPFIGRGWKLKLFSPFSGNRPIAACTLG